MEKRNLDDIKRKTLEIVDKYYPHTQCVILTGSQLEEDFLTPVSDIDIVLIDETFCDTSSDGAKEGDFKVDFTRVSLINLFELLVDFCYSISPIAAQMLRTGCILRDYKGIASLAKKWCEQIYNRDCYNGENEIKALKILFMSLCSRRRRWRRYAGFFACARNYCSGYWARMTTTAF